MLGASVQNCIQVNKIRRFFCKDHYSTGNYMVRLGLLLFAILILVYQVFDVIICQHFVGFISCKLQRIYIYYIQVLFRLPFNIFTMSKQMKQAIVCLLILSACLNSTIGQVTGSDSNQPGTVLYENISLSVFDFNISFGYIISYILY